MSDSGVADQQASPSHRTIGESAFTPGLFCIADAISILKRILPVDRMSITPRISAFWTSELEDRMGTSGQDDVDEETVGLVAGSTDLEANGRDAQDGRTPLDKTIDRIGMGE